MCDDHPFIDHIALLKVPISRDGASEAGLARHRMNHAARAKVLNWMVIVRQLTRLCTEQLTVYYIVQYAGNEWW